MYSQCRLCGLYMYVFVWSSSTLGILLLYSKSHFSFFFCFCYDISNKHVDLEQFHVKSWVKYCIKYCIVLYNYYNTHCSYNIIGVVYLLRSSCTHGSRCLGVRKNRIVWVRIMQADRFSILPCGCQNTTNCVHSCAHWSAPIYAEWLVSGLLKRLYACTQTSYPKSVGCRG